MMLVRCKPGTSNTNMPKHITFEFYQKVLLEVVSNRMRIQHYLTNRKISIKRGKCMAWKKFLLMNKYLNLGCPDSVIVSITILKWYHKNGLKERQKNSQETRGKGKERNENFRKKSFFFSIVIINMQTISYFDNKMIFPSTFLVFAFGLILM